MLKAFDFFRVNGENTETIALQSGDEILSSICPFVLQAPGMKALRDQVKRKPEINWKAGLTAADLALKSAVAA